MYADDMVILYEVFDGHKLQQDLTQIYKYYCINMLSINLEKTKYMIIRSLNSPLPINVCQVYVHNTEIERVATAKYLGLQLDECMTWKKHIQDTAKDICKPIGTMFKLRNRINQRTMKKIYYALVLSKLTYMMMIWTCAKEKYKKQLYTLQNRALKIVYHLPIYYSTTLLYGSTSKE